MDLGLKGKTAVVLGGSKGIGYAIAKAFLQEGARVAICARKEEELKKAAEELGALGEVYYEAMDVKMCIRDSQMAVHLPLSVEAQAECRFMLLSPNNLLKPSDGGPVAVPSQDMVLGIYYLTQERPGSVGEGMVFKSINEAILAYENKAVTLHSRVKVRVSKTMEDGSVKSGVVESTVGRFLFNEIIPQDLGFVDRSDPENEFKLEIDFHVGKKGLKQILEKVINTHGLSLIHI